MTRQERDQLIAQYAGGYDEVVRALDGFPARDLTAHPIAGKWSAAEIVHHLADSESVSAQRLRKLLVEDHAVIQGYDEAAWAVRLRYNDRELAPALAAFRAARETTANAGMLATLQATNQPRETLLPSGVRLKPSIRRTAKASKASRSALGGECQRGRRRP
jgi:hypothetical protein